MSKQDELLAPAPSGACAPMSDAEVICSWMEPKPGIPIEAYQPSPLVWWKVRYSVPEKRLRWIPHDRSDSLDALWEVEERLTDEQGQQYVQALGLVWPKDLLHATPEQKIKALAAVLRPLVTGARAGAVEPTSPSVEGR